MLASGFQKIQSLNEELNGLNQSFGGTLLDPVPEDPQLKKKYLMIQQYASFLKSEAMNRIVRRMAYRMNEHRWNRPENEQRLNQVFATIAQIDPSKINPQSAQKLITQLQPQVENIPGAPQLIEEILVILSDEKAEIASLGLSLMDLFNQVGTR